jgi:uncharacterized repeat protein (TIGR03806 family)
MEGPQPALPEAKKGPTPILPPVISHPHSESASITGGYVYHGKRLAELQGAYIYGDFQTGKIWGLRMSGQQISWKKELAQTPLQLVSFGEDNAGEIYLVDYQRTRQIYRLTKNPHAGERTQFPRRLSETGLFSSTVEQIPASGVTPFVINAPHWADHTMSQRWLAVPGDQPVSVDAEGSLTYPDGSVLAKTVSIEMKHGSPESRRRLETQVLHREQGSWRPYTYLWNEEQTDAVLASADGSDQLLKIQDPSAPEGLREQKYRFAARSECQLCHNAWVDAKTTMMGVQSASPLAMSLSQLNREIPTDGGTQNQLTALHQSGWLNGSIPLTAETSTGFVNPYDTSADLNQRARSYLHVNCAHCHQPHAGGSATIELTISSKLEDARLLGIRPAQGTFGISHASLLAPADPLGSVLYYRVSKLGSGRMPRIGSDEVDTAGVQLIHDWIAAMPPALQNAQVSQTSAVEPAQHASALKTLQANDASGYEPAVHQLCSSTRGALRLLQVLQSPNIPAAARSVVLNVAAAHPQAEVRDLFERFIPMSQRQQKLGTTVQVDQILSLTANPENGRQYFFREGAASCRGCHRVHGSGETLGPDLSQVGKKYGPRDMLSHLLEPSRFMEPKYVPYVLETKSGIVHTGLLVEKSDDAVTLKNIELREIRVPLSDVEHLTTQQKSIMPDLLLRDLTAQQAADLLAFLGTLN